MTHMRGAICGALLILSACAALADPIRVATFNAELRRKGPGLLLRDITRGKDDQIAAAVTVIARARPDILALQRLDWDYDGAALAALAGELKRAGIDYPYHLALRPNSGLATDLDLNGDGYRGDPEDAQGFGYFTGQGGIAVLSRFEIRADEVLDLTPTLWRDLPGALMPVHSDGSPFPSPEAWDIQRLSSTAHWVVPITLPDGTSMHLLTFQAGPPVFDGEEDRNGKRNHDEIMLWRAYLDGHFGPPVTRRFVLAGGANLDPNDSDGRRDAIRSLLSDPRLQDPEPTSPGGAQAVDQGHRSPNALDTVDWPSPGRMRVDYILPSADWAVADTGVFWPAPDAPDHELVSQASRHRLVWVDLIAPRD